VVFIDASNSWFNVQIEGLADYKTWPKPRKFKNPQTVKKPLIGQFRSNAELGDSRASPLNKASDLMPTNGTTSPEYKIATFYSTCKIDNGDSTTAV